MASLPALVVVCGLATRRLGEQGRAWEIASIATGTLAVISHLRLVWRHHIAAECLAANICAAPWRSCGLLFNGAVTLWLMLSVFSRWSVPLALSIWAWLAWQLAGTASEPRDRFVRGWIRFSVISFMLLYLLLGCGELYLRRNPLLVGGGGGGNPALKQIYAGLYTANSLGLRGPAVEPSKSAGTRRLLMLGDSFTFGQGVRDGEVYPRIVESNLRTEAASAGNWEVVNAGNAGKDMTYHWRFLEERGWRLQPDLITVQFFANDLEPQEVAESGGGSRGEPWWARIIAWPYRTSYAVFFSKYRFQQLLTRLDPDAAGKYSLDGWYRQLLREVQRNGPGWQSFCRHSRAIQASARRHDVPLIFFLFPHAGVPSPRESLLLQGVESFLIGEGIEVVNLDGMWQNLSPEEQVVSPIDNHPSAAAHRAAAARILAALRARQLVPSAP